MSWSHPFPKSTITDRFGDNEPPRTNPHRGTDYAPGARALIPAITDGVVTRIFYSNILGWVCEIKTDEHGLYVGHSHLYCNKHDTINCNGQDHHDGTTCMSKLKVGHKVKAGQPVGRVGNSGASRGAHVHMTIAKKSDPRYANTFDIEKFIDQKLAAEKDNNAVQRQKETKEEIKPQPVEPEKSEPTQFDKPPKGIVAALRMILQWLKSLGITGK